MKTTTQSPEGFINGFGTLRIEANHADIITMFKKDRALQSIVDTITQEGNEDELCKASDLYLLNEEKISDGYTFDIGMEFSDYVEKRTNDDKYPSIFEFDMMALNGAKLGVLYFIGGREEVKKTLERLY